MGPEMHARVVNIMIGFALGGIVAMLVGFKVFGWTTSKSAETMVEQALLTSQSSICAAQFMKQPNNQQKLQEFARMDSGQRSDFIEKGGWDVMPGQEKATWGVSRACVTGLEGMIKH